MEARQTGGGRGITEKLMVEWAKAQKKKKLPLPELRRLTHHDGLPLKRLDFLSQVLVGLQGTDEVND